MMRTTLVAALFVAMPAMAAAQVVSKPEVTGAEVDTTPPPMPDIPREFRAAWVASVANIDWPSKPGLSSWEQQAEMIAILNRAVALNLNAIILQVRPAADALYDSPHEPWSAYLTGRQGRAPEPYYDPLAFAVKEAHARGLELHAWFNPYRAYHNSDSGPPALTHLSQTKPDLVKQYGRLKWMDPGEPAVIAQSLRVILDVVRRYDIDGIHLDDYFYPYPINGPDTQPVPFPDSASYRKYTQRGGKLALDDWRRANVDTLIRRMYRGTRALKPWVKVGISPFGIWRPGFPETTTGFDSYARLYADSRLWLREGWVDYFTPQLYWPIAQTAQSYPVLLRWWMAENVKKRHMWPGHFTSRADGGTWTRDELIEQIKVTRAEGAGGDVHFSMKALMPYAPLPRDTMSERMRRDSAASVAAKVPSAPLPDGAWYPVADRLRATVYAEPALVPASPWMTTSAPPARPSVVQLTDTATGERVLRLTPAGARRVSWWTVRVLANGTWRTWIIPGAQRRLVIAPAGSEKPARVVVTAVDRYGRESARAYAR